MYNFDPNNVLLVIATNIPVLLMNAFVLQGHIFYSPNPTQYLNLTTTLLTISKHQIRSVLKEKS